jgi:hypothetical protein
MNRVLKTFLLWLLAFALPMQGYAAAAMFGCEAALPHAAVSQEEFGHDHAATSHMHAGAFHHHDSMQQVSDSHAQSHGSSNQHAYASSCSMCAACCVGMAMMPAALDWHPQHAGSLLRTDSLVVSFFDHIPPGIERPPRIILV